MNQGGNLEAGTGAEAMEEYCLLACSCGLFSLHSYSSQNYLTKGGKTYSELGPATSIINQDNAPKGLDTSL